MANYLEATGLLQLIRWIKNENNISNKKISKLQKATDLVNGQSTDFNPFLYGMPVVLYNNTTNKKVIVNDCNYNIDDYPLTTYTPIGIIVIPSSHSEKIYSTSNVNHGKPIMMSLKYMSCSNPNTGSNSTTYMYFGYNNKDLSELNSYSNLSYISDSTTLGTVYTTSSTVLLPGQLNIASPCFHCEGLFYNNTSYSKAPSPVLIDNDVVIPNPKYYTSISSSATTDFNGKLNTNGIISNITVTNWRTNSTISNSYSSGNYPAAACCWRYSTIGTSQGDWWLPSLGELGYMITFYKSINDLLTKLNKLSSSYLASLSSNCYYMSSSEYNSSYFYTCSLSVGLCNRSNKNSYCYVIAFCAVDDLEETEQTGSKFYTKEETEEQIATQINQLVDNAPEALNTLKELADAIGENKEILDVLKELKLSEDYQPAEEGLESLEPQPGDTIEVAISKLHKLILNNI